MGAGGQGHKYKWEYLAIYRLSQQSCWLSEKLHDFKQHTKSTKLKHSLKDLPQY